MIVQLLSRWWCANINRHYTKEDVWKRQHALCGLEHKAPIHQEAGWCHIRQIRYYEMLWGKSLYTTTTWDMRGIKLFLASACEGGSAWNMFSFYSSKALLFGVNQVCTVIWGEQTVRNRQPEPKAKQLQVSVPVWMQHARLLLTCRTSHPQH